MPSLRTNIVYDRKELESIFYSSPKTQVINLRSSKLLEPIYVVSRKSPAQDKFCKEVEGYLRFVKGIVFWYYEGPEVMVTTDKNIKYVPILTSSEPMGE